MNSQRESYSEYKSKIDKSIAEFLSAEINNSGIKNYKEVVYEPVEYILSSGGKRIRPLIVLLSCEAFGGNAAEAMHAAVAVELLHNFTLVHDDIMDNALTRRGIETVHRKWDTNTAILAGDELIAFSYKSLLRTRSANLADIVKTFTEGIIEVCEGQAMDKEFEAKNNVTLDEYLLMIRKKTAAMLRLSSLIGAMVANAKADELRLIAGFAEDIGIAFQIQDDLLDVYSSEVVFGKKIGGDIIERKKTYLYLKALELSANGDREELKSIFDSAMDAGKVAAVVQMYNNLGVIDAAKIEVGHYTARAADYLEKIGNKKSKEMLIWLSDMLLNRNN